MGEEKPDEELMGKRKPSPRLSRTPHRRRYYHNAQEEENIYMPEKIF